MNVPVLRPIVVRDAPRLKTQPWSSRAKTARPIRHPWFIVTIVLGVALLAVSFGAVLWDNIFPLHGATASQNPLQTIVFTQHQNGRTQIFTVDSHGQNLRQITAEDANTTQVSWSADGKRLVFVNDIDGHEQIYRIDATGTREARLTNDNLRDIAPSWSPGNLEISYIGVGGSNSAIWIINSDGTSPRKATDPSKTGTVFAPLAWAPDGHRIAFASGSSDRANIMLLTPKTGELRQLTNLRGYATNPTWSPDGTTLVFTVATTDSPTSYSVLYTIHADGTGLTQITNGDEHDGRPTWSPDGSHIAFVRMANQRSALFVVNADGSNARQLTFATGGQMFDFPAWTPDGGSILFVRHSFPSSPSDTATLEAIDTGGDNLRTLSTTLAPDAWPVIRPAIRPTP
jgi:Tol biopolymer transport system component